MVPATPRSEVQFPGNALTDKLYVLKAMEVALDESQILFFFKEKHSGEVHLFKWTN